MMDDDGGHFSRTFSTRHEAGCILLLTFRLRRARKSVFRSLYLFLSQLFSAHYFENNACSPSPPTAGEASFSLMHEKPVCHVEKAHRRCPGGMATVTNFRGVVKLLIPSVPSAHFSSEQPRKFAKGKFQNLCRLLAAC